MDDFSSDVFTTGVLPLGVAVDGSLEVDGDEDWFKATLKRFHDYQIEFRSLDGSITPQNNRLAELTLFDDAGRQFGSSRSVSDGSGFFDSAIFKYDGNGGTHFFGVTAIEYFDDPRFPPEPSSGDYRLQLETYDAIGDSIVATDAIRFFDFNRSGSRIDSETDLDSVFHRFPAGQSHTIEVLGADTGNGTLANPNLRVFARGSDNQTRLVAQDNNSGTGKNARLTLPATDEPVLYTIQVSGIGGTGTYELRSSSFDDFAENRNTTGVLPVNGDGTSAVFNFIEDTDWFQFEMRPGHRYDFSTDGENRQIQLFDRNGNFVAGGFGSFQRRNSDQTSSEFYIAVTGKSFEVDQSYNVQAQTLDDRASTAEDARFWDLDEFTSSLGAIETGGDRDWLQLKLAKFGHYTFTSQGVGEFSLSNPAVTVYDGNLNVIGSSEDGSVFLRPTEDQPVYVEFRAADDSQTGSYRFGVTTDRAGNDTSTGWTVDLTDTGGRIRSAIEYDADVDFHRIALTAGKWYRFDMTGGGGFSLQIPTGQNINLSAVNGQGQARPAYFFAWQTGDHYINVRQGDLASNFTDVGGYEFKIFEDSRRSFNGGYLINPALNERIGDRLSTKTGLFGERFEVYSTVPMIYESGGSLLTLQTGQLVELEDFEWGTLRVPLNFNGNGNVWSRAFRTVSGFADTSNWINSTVSGYVPANAVRRADGYIQDSDHTFAFASGLPEYLVGDSRFSEFGQLNATQQDAVREVVSSWANASSDVHFAEVAPGANNDSADTMVFFADLDSETLAFRLGDNEGGDLILNLNSPLMSDLSRGKQGRYEVVRAVGYILGLNYVTHVGRSKTVMGTLDSNLNLSSVFPSTPLPVDINALNNTGTRQFHSGSTGDDVYSITDESVFDTIIDGGGNDTISAENYVDGQVLIDLRQNQRSSAFETASLSSLHISNQTFIENAIGGSFSDLIVGSPFANRLEGGRGHDVIEGGGGNDVLVGGRNNDRYVFNIGDGSDTILEQGEFGFDTLEIKGPVSLDSLADDITFERINDDLLVRLELDSLPDRANDQILISDFASWPSRVESLELSNADGNFARVSLTSVFNQLSSARQRFDLSGSSDRWGSLVTPI